MEKTPKVSILMAYYDNTEHVAESIESVFNQTHPNFELIVVNDKSPSPEAQKLIIDLQKKWGFQLIQHEENLGASKAFNTAFRSSNGDFISLISHDDLYTADKLQHSIDLIHKHKLDAVYCNGIELRQNGEKIPFPTDEVSEKLAHGGQAAVADLISSKDTVGCLLTQGGVFKRHVYEELSWVRNKFLLDDWPLTIKVWRDYKTTFSNHPVYIYRQHENNIHKNYWRWFPARVQVISELANPEKKLDTLSFIMADIARFMRNEKSYNEAYKMAHAALFLAESDINIRKSIKIIESLSVEKADIMLRNQKIKDLYQRQKISYSAYKYVMKLAIGLIPKKSLRKSLRLKFKI